MSEYNKIVEIVKGISGDEVEIFFQHYQLSIIILQI